MQRAGIHFAFFLALSAALSGCRGGHAAETEQAVVAPNGAPTAGSSARPPSDLGTFESGLQSASGFSWVPVSDKVVGGVSTAQLELADGGAAGTGKALSIHGNVVIRDFPFPFAGAGLRLAETPEKKPRPVDVSGYQGIQFWAKGDGKQYVVRLVSPEVKDFNFHHFPFRATAEWTLQRVPWTALTQFKWGKKIPFSGKSLLQINFLNYSAPGDAPGSISLFVDEVTFF